MPQDLVASVLDYYGYSVSSNSVVVQSGQWETA